jgi:hypothetical protein
MLDKTKTLAICADDFGLSPGIDHAVVDLALRGRLSSTSVMVGGASFVRDAPGLLGLGDRIEVGLHLTLTDLAPLGPMRLFAPHGRLPTIGRVIADALAGRIDYAEIAAELRRQIARFEDVMGRPPAFVDGHQHVHVLPTVRRALLDVLASHRLDPATTWIRSCEEPPAAVFARRVEVPKTLFIAGLSAGLGAAARRRGALSNDSFRGVTGFEPGGDVRAVMRRFLTGRGRRALMMCHPATDPADADPSDTIMPARLREYAYFAGDDFATDLEAAGLRVGRFAGLP